MRDRQLPLMAERRQAGEVVQHRRLRHGSGGTNCGIRSRSSSDRQGTATLYRTSDECSCTSRNRADDRSRSGLRPIDLTEMAAVVVELCGKIDTPSDEEPRDTPGALTTWVREIQRVVIGICVKRRKGNIQLLPP